MKRQGGSLVKKPTRQRGFLRPRSLFFHFLPHEKTQARSKSPPCDSFKNTARAAQSKNLAFAYIYIYIYILYIYIYIRRGFDCGSCRLPLFLATKLFRYPFSAFSGKTIWICWQYVNLKQGMSKTLGLPKGNLNQNPSISN